MDNHSYRDSPLEEAERRVGLYKAKAVFWEKQAKFSQDAVHNAYLSGVMLAMAGWAYTEGRVLGAFGGIVATVLFAWCAVGKR